MEKFIFIAYLVGLFFAAGNATFNIIDRNYWMFTFWVLIAIYFGATVYGKVDL